MKKSFYYLKFIESQFNKGIIVLAKYVDTKIDVSELPIGLYILKTDSFVSKFVKN